MWIHSWVRDILDVGVTVTATLVFLRLLLGAHMLVPLVVVTSGSMVHDSGDASWMNWMVSEGILKKEIQGFPLTSGFNPGDMIIVIYPKASLGDVVIYERDKTPTPNMGPRDPIIHRVVGVVHVVEGQVREVEGSLDCYHKDNMSIFIEHISYCRENMKRCIYPKVPQQDTYELYITKG
ncbi:MAG: hypothetical protein GF334_13965, partial [Candidatus Altiarchaeales archaeon]|nr:hypothetical protein [Candidatus Altiarchaeales archaeon]